MVKERLVELRFYGRTPNALLPTNRGRPAARSSEIARFSSASFPTFEDDWLFRRSLLKAVDSFSWKKSWVMIMERHLARKPFRHWEREGGELISSPFTFMSNNLSAPQRELLEQQVQNRTGRRIRNLAIEFNPERVILRGRVKSYYLKQLAQHGVQESLPDLTLENSIVVEKDWAPAAFRDRM